MSAIRDEAMSQFTGGHWTVAALIVFFVVFIAFAAWTYRRSAKSFYQRMAHLPLDEGDQD